jgi:hypothetical protein
MVRTAWTFILALAVVSLALLGTGRATADVIVSSPVTSYYYAPPTVAYYSPPVVYSTPAPVVYGAAVSYYTPATVSYYTPAVTTYVPSVSYYAAPTAVTTTRYGLLLGRPRVISSYYPPVYIAR